MVLLEDTRNQPGKHKNIEAYCRQQGIEIVRTKLLCGDYMLTGPESGGICVDTKTLGVPEIASCVFQEHDRFRRQCEMAKKCDIQLIVLIEEVLPGGLLENWRSPMGKDGLPRHKFDPAKLKKAMLTMQDKYGVKFRFCDGRSTGRVLIEYLKGEREWSQDTSRISMAFERRIAEALERIANDGITIHIAFPDDPDKFALDLAAMKIAESIDGVTEAVSANVLSSCASSLKDMAFWDSMRKK